MEDALDPTEGTVGLEFIDATESSQRNDRGVGVPGRRQGWVRAGLIAGRGLKN